ncbi:MAG: insulinase family protein [Bacteroidales bacterium]|nr:insulinase family protein [Bacteroidales bacterium]
MDRTQQPKTKDLSEIGLLPVQRTVLPNGIPLMIINSEEQSVSRIDFMFGGGYWTQNQKLQALFTNSMLREGTAKYTSSQVAEKFDFYGSMLELSLLPQYSYITAYCLNKYIEQTLGLLESIVEEPVFPEKEYAVLLNRELQKFQINSTQAKYATMRNLRNALYGDAHPMGSRTTEADFDKLNTDMLRRYFDTHYNSNNCYIVLSGKITDRIVAQTEHFFGTAPFGNSQKSITFPNFDIKISDSKRIFEERSNSQQSSVKLGMHTIDQHHPDYHKFNVLVTILGGYFGSRLMSNIREEKGYTYGIYSGFSHEPDSSLLIITAEVSEQYVEPLIKEVYQEMDRLQNELVSEEELTIVRNYMTGALCRTMELSFSAADVYQMQFINHLSDSFLSDELKAIQMVTPQELQRLACRYLCKENLKEVISGKKNL